MKTLETKIKKINYANNRDFEQKFHEMFEQLHVKEGIRVYFSNKEDLRAFGLSFFAELESNEREFTQMINDVGKTYTIERER
jgi:hypothetical protein